MSYIPDNTQKTPFGEGVSVEPTPVIQISNKYQIDPALRDDLEIFEATGGSSDNNGNLFRCQTGTSVGGYGVIRSKEALIYRVAEGLVGHVSAKFTSGVANSLQFAGLFSLTETLAFGYNGTAFSTIYSHHGSAEVQTIQVTTPASSASNCTVTLDGDAVVIALTVSTVQTNAEQIGAGLAANGTVGAKWRFDQINDTIYAIARSVGNKAGTMSYAAGTTGSAATITEMTAGVDKTDSHTAQASWSVTTAPFSGFDPLSFNLYKIEFGFLGVANLRFYVYNPNIDDFVLVDRRKFASTSSITNVGNPDMKIGWTAVSLGSTTNLTVEGASAGASVLGKELLRNNSFSANNSVSGVNTTKVNILTIKNRILFGNRFNLGKIYPIEVSVDNEHNKAVVIEVYTNATIGGTRNFQFLDEFNSISSVDKAGTTVTGGILVSSFTVPLNGDVIVDIQKLKIALGPEDTLTIAARTTSGVGAIITAAITVQEEK